MINDLCYKNAVIKADKSGKHRIMLEGYGYHWYRVGGLDYLLRRTEIDENETKPLPR